MIEAEAYSAEVAADSAMQPGCDGRIGCEGREPLHTSLRTGRKQAHLNKLLGKWT